MKEVLTEVSCFHCGEPCEDNFVKVADKNFCCAGCGLVYEILQENNLCAYYELNKAPGVKHNLISQGRYSFLDEPVIKNKLIDHQSENTVNITFRIPSMHCSSCVWLLEKLRSLNPGIISSRVNFLKKELHVSYDEHKTSLRKIVEDLAATGYEPLLNLDALDHERAVKPLSARILKIGIAGFCFGNIMMLSFPEYFSSGSTIDAGLKNFFSYLILLLSLPVFFYSASEFFVKSFQALRLKSTSIDLPIALGITAIFARSVYEILSGEGQGYFDSGSGLIFFMLIGRWFQDFTFNSLSFDRNFKSYFPIAVPLTSDGIQKDVQVNDLKINDRFQVRHNEIVPVDSLLLKGTATIDYQFVTGESAPVIVYPGETIFAGGRQTAGLIELQVSKRISESYLTQLWNNLYESKAASRFDKLVQQISKWFIAITFFIALAAALFWWQTDIPKAVNAFTSVLIIACPCALALSAPFTYGNILRILGRNKIYLRDAKTIEKLADINTIVFDKTGTLTLNNSSVVSFTGSPLTSGEKRILYSLTVQSSHPLCRLLCTELGTQKLLPVSEFKEIPGSGISAIVNGIHVKAGSLSFAGSDNFKTDDKTIVFVNINNNVRGYFVFSNSYRTGVSTLSSTLSAKYKLSVLTGDNSNELDTLKKLFPGGTSFHFNQSPADKKKYISLLQDKGNKVLMVGDGLNDAGALLQSDVGISITDDCNSFSPASDGIIDASRIAQINDLLNYSKTAVSIIVVSFLISLLYNFIGLSFAVTGTLSPLIAAILMPISTISLVLFTVVSSTVKSKLLGFK
jgi:P-type Cu+ transporter